MQQLRSYLSFDAIVLAGGSAKRLDGTDKAALLVGGKRMLDRVLEATILARQTVVVGPERPTSRPVVWTREDPPGTGPVAALAAGLAFCDAPIVVLIAVDHPFVTRHHVRQLIEAIDSDGAMLRDYHGRDQPLVAAYRADSLRESLARLPDVEGSSMRELIEAMSMVALIGDAALLDCNTWEEVELARGFVTGKEFPHAR